MNPADIHHAFVLIFFVLLALLLGGSLTLWMVRILQQRADLLGGLIEILKEEVEELKTKANSNSNGDQ